MARETYKLTACTTIEKQRSYPQFLRSLKSKRLSIGSEFLLKFFLIFVAFCIAFVFALQFALRCVIVLHTVSLFASAYCVFKSTWLLFVALC